MKSPPLLGHVFKAAFVLLCMSACRAFCMSVNLEGFQNIAVTSFVGLTTATLLWPEQVLTYSLPVLESHFDSIGQGEFFNWQLELLFAHMAKRSKFERRLLIAMFVAYMTALLCRQKALSLIGAGVNRRDGKLTDGDSQEESKTVQQQDDGQLEKVQDEEDLDLN